MPPKLAAGFVGCVMAHGSGGGSGDSGLGDGGGDGSGGNGGEGGGGGGGGGGATQLKMCCRGVGLPPRLPDACTTSNVKPSAAQRKRTVACGVRSSTATRRPSLHMSSEGVGRGPRRHTTEGSAPSSLNLQPAPAQVKLSTVASPIAPDDRPTVSSYVSPASTATSLALALAHAPPPWQSGERPELRSKVMAPAVHGVTVTGGLRHTSRLHAVSTVITNAASCGSAHLSRKAFCCSNAISGAVRSSPPSDTSPLRAPRPPPSTSPTVSSAQLPRRSAGVDVGGDVDVASGARDSGVGVGVGSTAVAVAVS